MKNEYDDSTASRLHDLIIDFISEEGDVSVNKSLTITTILLSIAAKLHVLSTGGDAGSFIDASANLYKFELKKEFDSRRLIDDKKLN